MPAAIAAPPAKPVSSTSPPPAPPKPAGSPSPAPGRTDPPAPITEKPASEYLSDIENDLTDIDQADEAAKRGDPAPKRGPDGKFVKPGDKPDPEPEAEPDKPPVEPEKHVDEPKPGTMRALGKAYDQLKKERDEVLQPKLQSLSSKVEQYEKELTALKTQQPDLKPMQDKFAAIQKENEALREEIRFVNYRKHPEFAEKYEKPYTEAWNKAVSEVTQLSMEMEDGTVRKATANDLLALANAPLDQLDDLAGKWFPRSSARVIRHVEKIRDLAEAQDKALETAKKGATEFETKRAEEMQKQNGTFQQAFTGATAELTKKYAKYFAPDEADPAGNELLKKGFDYADTVFTPNGTALTPEQKAGRLAVIRAKAANHDRLVSRLKARDARIAELEADLKAFENSEPSTTEGGEPGRVGTKDWQQEVEDELKKLDKR